jgi:hypothetical protein
MAADQSKNTGWVSVHRTNMVPKLPDKHAKDIVLLKSEKNGSKAMAIWTFCTGIFMFIGCMAVISDENVNNTEMAGILFWGAVTLILGLRVLFTTRPGKWIAGTGLVLAAISFLGTMGFA